MYLKRLTCFFFWIFSQRAQKTKETKMSDDTTQMIIELLKNNILELFDVSKGTVNFGKYYI